MREVLKRPRRAHMILAMILIAFLLLGTVYSVTVPIFEASDELWHYPMVEVIARTWTLPVQPLQPGATSGPWRQEGSQQPLYYALGAVLTFWIDTSDMPEVRQPNPHARAGEITPERDNVNLVIPQRHSQTDAKGVGLGSGTVLAVHIVRLFSVLLGVWAVALTWRLVRELFPKHEWIALTATAVHAFTPMYLFISSSVNNDNLTVPLCSLGMLLMVRRVKHTGGGQGQATETTNKLLVDKQRYAADLKLGVVLGLAMLTKSSGLGLLPFVAAMLAWESFQLCKTTSWVRSAAHFFAHLVGILTPALAISGWWYARNLRLYGDLLGWRAFEAVLGTRDVPASLGQLWAERFAFAAGYWGNFGGLNVPMPDWIYHTLNGLAIVAGAGLLAGLGRWAVGRDHVEDDANAHSDAGRPRRWNLTALCPFTWRPLTAARALAWAWPVAIFASWIRWATTTWSSQGRLIFPAISMWSLALVLGLSAWIPRQHKRLKPFPAIGISLFLFGLTAAALPVFIVPAYQPPKALTQATLPPDYVPLSTTFGDTLELLGYRLNTDRAHPDGTLDVELMWRARRPTLDNHTIFIHVLGVGDRIIAQRDSFPGHGLLPTTKFEGDRVWTERHILKIPRTAYTPDRLSVTVGLYGSETGARVPVSNAPSAASASEEATAFTAKFGELTLVSPDNDESIEIRFGDGIVLDDYELSDVIIQTGDPIEVTLDWRCVGPIAHDYTVSLQVIDTHWNKAAQSDTWPLNGERPTTSWEPGETIRERHELIISPDAAPGAYDLRLTLYRVTSNGDLEHLPISLTRTGMPTKAIVLTPLRITQ
jgi:hypothetical protein